ncbi:hypothetical protein SUGI_1228280 [Cryptomeria japonica]|uniref:Uncharacterized protein n=1 Tax=Cryptomeria japonica TaxID=3369 RepID=A0AAD3NN30_CRYJA|nr:hypothetical protein SUGI_1228280 [Cryptomeria japonica]
MNRVGSDLKVRSGAHQYVINHKYAHMMSMSILSTPYSHTHRDQFSSSPGLVSRAGVPQDRNKEGKLDRNFIRNGTGQEGKSRALFTWRFEKS